MKVEYIYHSGFTIDIDEYFLVFDYYMGEIPLEDKKTIVFVTHKHQDHFNPVIFDWQKVNPNINYVLSSDLDIDEDENIFKMDPYEEVTINNIEIKSFGSTDLGLSFLIKIDGKYIFYAGDLNWWHWANDSLEDQLKEERDFKNELAKIDKLDLDLAFFPVDPRLGEGYSYGGSYFIEKFKPKVFFPMHFADKLEVTARFARDFKSDGVRIMEINKENQSFNIF